MFDQIIEIIDRIDGIICELAKGDNTTKINITVHSRIGKRLFLRLNPPGNLRKFPGGMIPVQLKQLKLADREYG